MSRKPKEEGSMLYFNTGTDPEALISFKETVMGVLECEKAGDAPKVEALKALRHVFKKGDTVNLENFTFYNGVKKP